MSFYNGIKLLSAAAVAICLSNASRSQEKAPAAPQTQSNVWEDPKTATAMSFLSDGALIRGGATYRVTRTTSKGCYIYPIVQQDDEPHGRVELDNHLVTILHNDLTLKFNVGGRVISTPPGGEKYQPAIKAVFDICAHALVESEYKIKNFMDYTQATFCASLDMGTHTPDPTDQLPPERFSSSQYSQEKLRYVDPADELKSMIMSPSTILNNPGKFFKELERLDRGPAAEAPKCGFNRNNQFRAKVRHEPK